MPLEVVDVCDDDGVSGESLIGKAGAMPAFLILGGGSMSGTLVTVFWLGLLRAKPQHGEEYRYSIAA